MSREALQESLSAVMDNEADELELRRVLNACDDVETRETWARYQIARAVMHKDLLLPRLDIAAAVSAALADEAVPAKAISWSMAQPGSPGRCRFGDTGGTGRCSSAQPGRDRWRRTGAAIHSTRPGVPQVKGPAVLAGYNEEFGSHGPDGQWRIAGQPGWNDQRLPGYLRQHAQAGCTERY